MQSNARAFDEDEAAVEQDLPRPRFSLPIDDESGNKNGDDDEDDDDFLLRPPRLSQAAEEDEDTTQTIELPRRALNERLKGRLSHGSFGSIRTSDRFNTLLDSDAGLLEDNRVPDYLGEGYNGPFDDSPLFQG